MEAKSQSDKFHVLHQKFSEVHSDLEKVGNIDQLQHHANLNMFIAKLPTTCKVWYEEHRSKKKESGKKILDIVCTFFNLEHKHLNAMEGNQWG